MAVSVPRCLYSQCHSSLYRLRKRSLLGAFCFLEARPPQGTDTASSQAAPELPKALRRPSKRMKTKGARPSPAKDYFLRNRPCRLPPAPQSVKIPIFRGSVKIPIFRGMRWERGIPIENTLRRPWAAMRTDHSRLLPADYYRVANQVVKPAPVSPENNHQDVDMDSQ